MMKRIFLFLLAFLSFASYANAQRFGQRMSRRTVNYFDFYVGMGMHSMLFSPDEGDKNGRVGATAGAYYRRAMTPKLHLMTGLGASLYSARSKFSNMVNEMDYTDPENGEECMFKTTFKNWEEIQRTINLEVPVGAYYIRKIRRIPWYLKAGGGLMLNIPVMKKFKTDNPPDGYLKKSVKFSSTNVEYEDLPQHGLDKDQTMTGKADIRSAGLSLFIDAGMMHDLKKMKGKSIYVGIYYYQSVLNSLGGNAETKLYDPSNDNYSGVVSSDLVDKSLLMAVGVKFAFTIGL